MVLRWQVHQPKGTLDMKRTHTRGCASGSTERHQPEYPTVTLTISGNLARTLHALIGKTSGKPLADADFYELYDVLDTIMDMNNQADPRFEVSGHPAVRLVG